MSFDVFCVCHCWVGSTTICLIFSTILLLRGVKPRNFGTYIYDGSDKNMDNFTSHLKNLWHHPATETVSLGCWRISAVIASNLGAICFDSWQGMKLFKVLFLNVEWFNHVLFQTPVG